MCQHEEQKMAGDSSKSKIQRYRHFWGWVTKEKKFSKGELVKNRKLNHELKREHENAFPHLYKQTKGLQVRESIKMFQRKLLTFCKTFISGEIVLHKTFHPFFRNYSSVNFQRIKQVIAIDTVFILLHYLVKR